jgi:hypothetical protein
MYPLSAEKLFLVSLDVDLVILASVALDDALPNITGVDCALGLLPISLCMGMGQNITGGRCEAPEGALR